MHSHWPFFCSVYCDLGFHNTIKRAQYELRPDTYENLEAFLPYPCDFHLHMALIKDIFNVYKGGNSWVGSLQWFAHLFEKYKSTCVC
jgi:hypothetical protein